MIYFMSPTIDQVLNEVKEVSKILLINIQSLKNKNLSYSLQQKSVKCQEEACYLILKKINQLQAIRSNEEPNNVSD